MQERDGVMVFKPKGQAEIVISSPEELVTKGIGIHPDVIEQTWGPEAIERYRDAVIAQRTGKPVIKTIYDGNQTVTVFKGGGLDFAKGHSLHF